MRNRIAIYVIGCSVSLACVSGCSGLRTAPRHEHQISHLIPYTLRVRRPPGPGADPRVGPGGTDYTSHPLPSANLDCETARELFANLDLAGLRTCLSSLKSSVRYRLKRVDAPALELEGPEHAPACLNALLPSIPVPREIFFQSEDEERLLCYSSRLDIEANELAGFKVPSHRLDVRLDFPLLAPPKDDDETRRLLLSWAITPFWNETTSELPSHIVTDEVCRACLGEKNMIKPQDGPQASWP